MYGLVPYSNIHHSAGGRSAMPAIFPELFNGIDRVFDRFNVPVNNFFGGSLLRNYENEDGSSVLEYNLAGYESEEIKVKVDTMRNELLIAAQHTEDNNQRSFRTSVSLSPYTLAEDINVDYVNGVLKISVAPVEKRKQESLTEIPINVKRLEQDKDTDAK